MLIKVCVNGARSPAEHPKLPVTPAQIASEVAAALAVGAGAAHVHVKDTYGSDTLDGTVLDAVLMSVREAAPGIAVGVTTGAWATPEAADRVEAIRGWRILPDFASVNWHEPGADAVADVLLGRGVEVEAGLWHANGVDAWLRSPHRDRCLRVLAELPDGLGETATRVEANRLLQRLREGVEGTAAQAIPVLLHGEGTSCWPGLRMAVQRGLDVRVGLEDTLVMPDGSAATSNASLVAAARRIVEAQSGPSRGR